MKRDDQKTKKDLTAETAKQKETAQDNLAIKELKQHFGNHQEIDTTKVQIKVKSGNVDLEGEVDNAHAKSLMCSIAEQEVTQTKTVNADKVKVRRDNSQAP